VAIGQPDDEIVFIQQNMFSKKSLHHATNQANIFKLQGVTYTKNALFYILSTSCNSQGTSPLLQILYATTTPPPMRYVQPTTNQTIETLVQTTGRARHT
jgi:hypothetical protein